MISSILVKFIRHRVLVRCLQIIIFAYKILNQRLLKYFPKVRNELLFYPYFLYKKLIEDQTYKIFNKIYPHLKNGCIIDVGACLGYTAKCFANKDFSNRTVFAFEPHPHNYQQLKKISQSVSNIIPFNLAVGARKDEISIWENQNSFADHRVINSNFDSRIGKNEKRIQVSMTSIDLFTKESGNLDVALIKIDVQGYEVEVCYGMIETIKKNSGIMILIELSPIALTDLGFDFEEVFSFFSEKSFDCYSLQDGRIIKVDLEWLTNTLKIFDYIDVIFSKKNLDTK